MLESPVSTSLARPYYGLQVPKVHSRRAGRGASGQFPNNSPRALEYAPHKTCADNSVLYVAWLGPVQRYSEDF